MAYVIPIVKDGERDGERGPVVLIIVLTRENLDRMREADPFDLKTRDLGAILIGWKAKDLDIVIAYEEDESFIGECQKTGDIKALIGWIERGRRHRPEQGDATPPVSLRRKGN